MKRLSNILKANRIYIYGTGIIAMRIRWFLKVFFRDVDGFVISDELWMLSEIDGISVYKCGEVPYTNNDIMVIAVSPMHYNEIVKKLVLNNIENVYFIENALYSDIVEIEKLSKKGINVNGEMLNFGEGFIVPNYFKKKLVEEHDINISAWIYEFKDLVYPYLNEWNFVVEGPYEYEAVRLGEGDVVFDCGANFGLFSAKAASKNCKVYSFEPVPQIVECLKLTKNIYKDNMIIVPKALAEKTKTATFYMNNENVGAGSLYLDTKQETLEVEVTSIDEFVKENSLECVDFIKADIEGAERWMLEGAQETLRKYAPKLAICTYHLPDDVMVLTDLIKKANPSYKIVYGWQKLYAWVE